MADVESASHRDFHAGIREVEPGTLRAEYRGELNPDHPGDREFPDYTAAPE